MIVLGVSPSWYLLPEFFLECVCESNLRSGHMKQYGFSAITRTCSWANIFRAMCDASFYWLHFITQPCPPEHTLVIPSHIFAPLLQPYENP